MPPTHAPEQDLITVINYLISDDGQRECYEVMVGACVKLVGRVPHHHEAAGRV